MGGRERRCESGRERGESVRERERGWENGRERREWEGEGQERGRGVIGSGRVGGEGEGYR